VLIFVFFYNNLIFKISFYFRSQSFPVSKIDEENNSTNSSDPEESEEESSEDDNAFNHRRKYS